MPTATRPGTGRPGQTAIDRLRAAKLSADHAAARVAEPHRATEPTADPVSTDCLVTARRPTADPVNTREPVNTAKPVNTAHPVTTREPVNTAHPEGRAEPTLRRGVPGSEVSSRSRRGSVMGSRARAAIVAALVLVLFAGVGVLASTASRGALAASTAGSATVATVATTNISTLVNPDGVLSPPLARKLVDGSAIEPIDSTPYQITLGGIPRYFRIHFPGGVAPSSARPLIIVLPGWRRSARDAERQYGFDQLSNTSGAVIAYLDGVHNSWDAGTCCGYAASEKLDDVGALHVIVDALANLVQVDRRHVVLAGFSNGAMLAYRAACAQSAQLAGLIIASGSLQVSGCKPGPLSIVASHGARDRTLPIDGVANSVYLKGPVTSMAASLAPFEKADACASTTSQRSGRYAITALRRCASGVTVNTYVDGLGGHDWPGRVPVTGVVGGQSFAYTSWQLLGGRSSVVPFSP